MNCILISQRLARLQWRRLTRGTGINRQHCFRGIQNVVLTSQMAGYYLNNIRQVAALMHAFEVIFGNRKLCCSNRR